MKKDWKLIRRIKSGHSYWRREQDGAVGIADDSGTYPEDCEPADRPPLLLDRTRPVHLGRDATLVPVKHDDGDLSHTPVGPKNVGRQFDASRSTWMLCPGSSLS
jgi:hypothetical protein